MKKALVTGIGGQDGSYLAELLLEKGYEVHGLVRSASTPNTSRIDHIRGSLTLHYGDLTDALSMHTLVAQIQPDELYNLAAMSHVHMSFDQPLYTAHTDGIGTLNVLEAVRAISGQKACKVYQASTSELYGGMKYNMPETGYTEDSPFHPRSPYGCAKLYAYWIARNYREAYKMFVCNGILFNHESPRRTETFVTQKVIQWAKNWYWSGKPLLIGNLDSKRDWGHSIDYVRAMWMILQQDTPDDFVIATGRAYSVREFIDETMGQLGRLVEWKGSTGSEIGYIGGHEAIKQVPQYFRPSEVDILLGDSSKARSVLGWEPEYDLTTLIHDMLETDND